MMAFMHGLHSGIRYLVLAAALAAIVAAVVGWKRAPGTPAGAERTVMLAFVGLLDLQVVTGLILLFLWPYYPALIGHIMMMVLAAIVAHAGSVMARRREPARNGAPLRVAAVVAALVLVIGGIMAIQRPIL
jgi:hypothetical protein